MSIQYRSAKTVPSAVADPATLASDAVRCIWVRPTDGRFLPTVIFKDGTDCPLACTMDVLSARQFCQRISAVYDWHVVDDRPKTIGPEIAAEVSWASVPAEFKSRIDGQDCVNMRGIGHMMADMCRAYQLPLGVAIHRVSERIGSFIAAAVEGGAMSPEDGRRQLDEATQGALEKLDQLYAGEDGRADPSSVTPMTLGVMLADYHASKGSDDGQFQHGLGAALDTAVKVWEKAGADNAETQTRTSATIDAAIRHWFALRGRIVPRGFV